MPLRYLRAFYTGSISAGSYSEKTWTPHEDVHVKKILFVDRDGLGLSKVDVYVKVGEKVITRDQVPASVFGQDMWISLDVDIDVAKGTEIYFKIVNNDSVAHDIAVVLVITE